MARVLSAIWKPPGPDGVALSDPAPDDIAGRWTLPAQTRLEWREWDGEFAVYNSADDAVHFLDETNAAVFAVLLHAGQPLSIDQLAGQMLACYAAETTASQVIAVLREILPQFRRLGLAERRLDVQ